VFASLADLFMSHYLPILSFFVSGFCVVNLLHTCEKSKRSIELPEMIQKSPMSPK
jgi:hypothetical protein